MSRSPHNTKQAPPPKTLQAKPALSPPQAALLATRHSLLATSSSARVLRGTPRNIALLARALRRGQLVAVPTETVYGLAANALSPAACAAIFRAKGRPANDPLIAHIHDLAQLDQLAHRNPAVEKLARAFWPGPLTIVLPKKPIVPDIATSGLPSVAIRMPAHPLFRALLKKCALPLAAPSANPFGYISPTRAAHVRDGLGKKIPRILDGGECAIGLESTIVDLRDPRRPAILRPGKISAKQIARVLRTTVAEPENRNWGGLGGEREAPASRVARIGARTKKCVKFSRGRSLALPDSNRISG
jgi:L-threonylcarbamoyladenylate synthase